MTSWLKRDTGASWSSGGAGFGIVVMLWLLATGIASRGDSVYLKSGERVNGTRILEDASRVVVQSTVLGRVEIPRDQIERIEVESPPDAASRESVEAHPSEGEPVFQYAPWLSDPAGDKAFDWIQIKSQEWLKGRVKSLQEETLEFDSEELDLLSFDWEKVRALYSPRRNSIRFDGEKPLDGYITVTPSEVRVETNGVVVSRPREDLIAIAPAAEHERNRWTGKLSAGVSLRSGNTREMDLTASGTLQRRTPQTRLSLDYLGNYSQADGRQLEQNHRAIGQFDSFFSRRFYARFPDVEYYRDPLQNLEHRLTLGAGVGYDLLKTSRTEWNVTLGPAWQRNIFASVPDGQSRVQDAVALVASTHLDIELTRMLDLILEYRGQVTRAENGDNTHHAVIGLEFEIHKKLQLDLSFVWDRITNPQQESAGDTPSADDFRLITSLGLEF